MARPRLLLIVAMLALVAPACGGTHSAVRAPFAKVSFTEAGGWGVMSVGPTGVTLRFVPNTAFGIGIVLRNHSAERVTLVDVETPLTPNGLVRQIGTVLAPWHPPTCRGTIRCPAIGFLRAPYRAGRPAAVAIASRGEAAVQLVFRMRGCSAVPFAAAGAPDRIAVSYRVGGGHVATQELRLGDARLRLRMPSRRDCLPTPKSDIAVDGPYATGSDWTEPTSSGDSCTRTASGALIFESRVYLAPRKPAVRIWIRLPRRGPARVTAVVGIGIHGWQHFHSEYAVVTVRRQTPKTASGRFHATIVGYRHSTFRAFGAWRCELT